MKNTTIIDKLLHAMRYLWHPGNILYWGLAALAATLLGLHELRQMETLQNLLASRGITPESSDIAVMAALIEASQTLKTPWHLWLFSLLANLLFLCKCFDGIMRLSEGLENEPVPYAPTSLVSIFLPLKYFVGILICVICLLPLLLLFKTQIWLLIAAILFWLFTPAMIMNLIGNNSLSAMLSPLAWIQTLRNLGAVNYLAILLLPLLPIFLGGMVVGLTVWFTQSPKLMYILLALLQSYGVALVWIYCGYFMRADADNTLSDEALAILADADTRAMSHEDRQRFAQDMLAVDLLIEEGANSGIEDILLPYSRLDIPTWFPAYRRLYHYYCRRGGRDVRQALENRLLEAAAQDHAPAYQLLADSLKRIAEETPERLAADWIQPLARHALAAQDADMVLRLTRNFARRHPGHAHIFANYLLAAKALAQQGNTAAARKLLEQLLNRYPDHPRAAQARRMQESLQPSTGKQDSLP